MPEAGRGETASQEDALTEEEAQNKEEERLSYRAEEEGADGGAAAAGVVFVKRNPHGEAEDGQLLVVQDVMPLLRWGT